MTDTAELTARYRSALEGYLAGSGEAALQEAYEVGRQALDAGLGPLVLFSIHRDVVRKLPPQPIEAGEFISEVTTVFIETLAPFQMTYATFDEARAAVDELTGMLTDHVAVIETVRERLDRLHETAAARRRLIADIVSAQEEERRRIAGEIHDDAMQAMVVVGLRLSLLGKSLTEPEQVAALDQLAATVRESVARLRKLIAGLVPPELERAGLAPAVRSLLEQLQAEFEIETQLEDRLETDPRPEVRTIAFRIVQEALANARKHAKASRIEVLFDSREGGLLARVSDDGAGFEVESALKEIRPGHLGLAAMRERAQLVGGWLQIESGTNGTTVEFWIPDGQAPPTDK